MVRVHMYPRFLFTFSKNFRVYIKTSFFLSNITPTDLSCFDSIRFDSPIVRMLFADIYFVRECEIRVKQMRVRCKQKLISQFTPRVMVRKIHTFC